MNLGIQATDAGFFMVHEDVSVLRITENPGRTLFKIRWERGGESVLLAEDLESPPQ